LVDLVFFAFGSQLGNKYRGRWKTSK
jgi:hypothetical protein